MKDAKEMTNEQLISSIILYFGQDNMIEYYKSVRNELLSRLQSTVSHELPVEEDFPTDEEIDYKAAELAEKHGYRSHTFDSTNDIEKASREAMNWLKSRSKALAVKPDNNGWVSVKDRLPEIGDYYYVKIDTKNDNVLKTIVEWGKFRNGNYDWDFKNVSHFGSSINEDSDVIEWLDESVILPPPPVEKGGNGK